MDEYHILPLNYLLGCIYLRILLWAKKEPDSYYPLIPHDAMGQLQHRGGKTKREIRVELTLTLMYSEDPTSHKMLPLASSLSLTINITYVEQPPQPPLSIN